MKSLKEVVSGKKDTNTEDSSVNRQFRDFAVGGMSLRNSEFIEDIYSEEVLTPHEEMRAGFRMMHNDPDVASAIGTRTDTIIGDRLSVETDDDDTKEYFEEEVMPKLRRPLRNAIRDMSMTGNGYIEVLRGKNTGVPMDFEEMQRPHKVYIDFEDGTFNIDKYVIQQRGLDSGESFDVRYYNGRRKTVRGFPMDKENIVHLREGSGVIPKYGRSDFLSAVDSYKIRRELLRSQAVISRQKSIPRKLISVNAGDTPEGVDVPNSGSSTKKRKQIEAKISSMGDYENPVFYNTEIDVKDFDYDPQVGENQEVLRQLGKQVTAAMPDFITNPEGTNRATSKEEKQQFHLSMQSVRGNIKDAVNPVLKEIAENNGYATDVSLKFGDYDFPTREEKLENAAQLFQDNVITRNEARDMIDMESVEDEYDGFLDDVTEQPANPLEALSGSSEEDDTQ